MRVALIADIHGNLAALEAVLASVAKEQPDQTVCLGDVAGTGPQPKQVVQRLRALAYPVVMGNVDERLFSGLRHPPENGDSRLINDIDDWCAAQLAQDDLDYLRTFRATIEIPLDGKASLLCFHGSPRSNTELITATTPEAELDQILGGYRATVMAGGHTHVPMIRSFHETLIVNPGSVGLPVQFVSPAPYNPPWAEYAMITSDHGELRVDLRRVPYDVTLTLQAARASGMPHVDLWSADWRTE